MPQLKIKPHQQLCPNGLTVHAKPGETICSVLLSNGINIEHACEQSCACTTCHIIVCEGFSKLIEAEDKEDDLLDKAWGVEPTSRLSCQVVIPEDTNLTIEIPRYTINHAREN